MNAIKLQRFAHSLLRLHIPFLPGIIYRWIHFRYNSDLSPALQIGAGTTLGHGGIGVVVNAKAKIGRNVILAQNVTIAGKDGVAPTLDDWVYVGANSVVLGGHIWERMFLLVRFRWLIKICPMAQLSLVYQQKS